MKEELYKYLSIGLLALLLLVCFGSLVTYFVVRQESLNTAYAMESGTGYYEDNLYPISDCTKWSFNLTGQNLDFYQDDDFEFHLLGNGSSLVNNVFSSTSGESLLRVVFKHSMTSGYYTYVVGYSSNSGSVVRLQENSVRNFTNNSTYNYFYYSVSHTPQMYWSLEIACPSGSSITLRYLCLQYGVSSFRGYVPKSYSNYGYDQGYTDGVNSAGGGTVPGGITDLTDTTWRAPSTASNTSLDGEFSVSGYLDSIFLGSRFTFDGIDIFSGNSVFGDPVEESPGNYTSPLFFSNSSIISHDRNITIRTNTRTIR